MFPLLHLLAALSGQFLPYTPAWQMEPEKTIGSPLPTPRDRWDFAKSPRWSFVRTDWTAQGAVNYRDTTLLSWESVGGVYEEIHLGSKGVPRRFLKTWLKAHGVDTLRAKRDLLFVDSLKKWTRPEEGDPWSVQEVVRCHDTVVGRACVDSLYESNAGGLEGQARWIRERADNGYLVGRDTLQWVAGAMTLVVRDSVRREANGKPLERIHWAYSWSDDSLEEDHRVEWFWTGSRLDRAKTTSLFDFERVLYWGAGGRLDSALTPPVNNGIRYQYDAQGRLVGMTGNRKQDRLDLDAQGRLVAFRMDEPDDLDPSVFHEFSLDSFVLDGQGRLSVAFQCTDFKTTTMIDRSLCTRSTYEYDVSVGLGNPARTRPVGHLRHEGSRLVAQGISGRPLTLKILRPDGRVERTEKAMGEIRLEIRDLPKGLLLWSLESEGSAQANGRIWLPAR